MGFSHYQVAIYPIEEEIKLVERHIAQMKNQECTFEQKWGKLAVLAV